MRILAVVSGLLVALSGCWRYRVVPSTCPAATVERTSFDITAARTTGNEIRGQVVTSDSGKPIAEVRVDYPTSGEPGVVTAADGEFSLRAESLGVYTLRARRIGYAQALGSVHLRADSGGPLRLLMHQSTLVLDGCGYAQLREARPWWQWWFPPPAV